MMHFEPEIQEYISAGKVPTVMVVDDSKVIRAAIREVLELGNLKVVEADAGKVVLELVSCILPDLILLDVELEETDGMEVLALLRKQYSKMQLPVVLLTQSESTIENIRALDMGANDYVTKPIDLDVLWARLSNQLMQKKAAEYLLTAQEGLELQYKRKTAELKLSNRKLKQEIQERLITEDKLQKQASYDELTGLPNRSLATDRLDQAILKAGRQLTQPCVAFIDLDNFKYVNDTLGHAAGDELLCEAARRLDDCARKSDTVARLGGDEFLLILEDTVNQHYQERELEIRHVGDRILDSFSRPFVLGGKEIAITPSVGFAVFPKDGKDGNILMRHADAAMYRSKHDGKNTYCFYSPEMTVKAKMRMNVESQLRHALDRQEFTLLYQPIVEASTGQIVKAEALLRWKNSELGMISPDHFIPVAEDTGLIMPIGQWVIDRACQQVRQWHDSGWTELGATVNVSPQQLLTDKGLIEDIEQSLGRYQLAERDLQIELTESALTCETPNTLEVMSELSRMGIKLLLDDFGTGYASLTNLQKYDVDSIKIDRNFINNVLLDSRDEKLVKAAIAIAYNLDISVVSEGVETAEQLRFLLDADCEYAQGYFFSKPVSGDEFDALMKKCHQSCKDKNNLSLLSCRTST